VPSSRPAAAARTVPSSRPAAASCRSFAPRGARDRWMLIEKAHQREGPAHLTACNQSARSAPVTVAAPRGPRHLSLERCWLLRPRRACTRCSAPSAPRTTTTSRSASSTATTSQECQAVSRGCSRATRRSSRRTAGCTSAPRSCTRTTSGSGTRGRLGRARRRTLSARRGTTRPAPTTSRARSCTGCARQTP
jgi:hypothetical protein